jgi:hypothetical protein
MMRRLGGFLLIAFGVAVMIAQGVHASERNSDSFDGLVKALSARYEVHPKSIPLMWMVSLCAKGYTHGGVRGLKVIQFEDVESIDDHIEFETMVEAKLGEDWSRAVREWEEKGEESLVYVRTGDGRVEMIVVNLEHRELNMVKMTMNPDQFAKWVREKETKEKDNSAVFQ